MSCPKESRLRAQETRARADLAQLARRAANTRSETTLARLKPQIAPAKALVSELVAVLEGHRAECEVCFA